MLAARKLKQAAILYTRNVQNPRKIHLNGSTAKKMAGVVGLALTSSAGFVLYQIHCLKQRLNVGRYQTIIDKWQSYRFVEDYDETTGLKWKRKKISFARVQVQLLSHDPGVLLSLTQCDDHSVRLLAVQALAKNHDWTDEQCSFVAQNLDHRTMVALARTPNVDKRLIPSGPELKYSETELDEQLRSLIVKMPLDNLDKCTKFFTQRAMQECPEAKKLERGALMFHDGQMFMPQPPNAMPTEIKELLSLEVIWRHSLEFIWSVDGNSISAESSQTAFDRVVFRCLRALVEFSYLPSHCGKLVSEGGLTVLRRVCQARQNSVKIKRCAALILANLALQPALHEDITKEGWVPILRDWMNGRDLELSLKAAKALANLDEDFAGQRKYAEGVYLYYPQTRFSEPVEADIVFVHGLLGGPFRTWRQKDSVREAQAKILQLQEEKKRLKDTQQKSQPQLDQLGQAQPGQHDFKGASKQTQIEYEKINDKQSNGLKHTTLNNVPSTENTGKEQRNEKSEQSSQNTLPSKQDSSNVTAIDESGICTLPENPWSELKEKLSKFKSVIERILHLGKKREKSTRKGGRAAKYTFCWPQDWLTKDIANSRIISVGYETYLNEWEEECPYESEKRALAVRSHDMLEKLRKAGVGERPIIWVGHSMGGLLIKQMLVHAENDVRYRQIVEQSRGIVFYSVPHRGSQLADYALRVRRIYAPSVEVKELVTGCPQLLDLHEKFKDLMFETGIPLLSFAEGRETLLPFKFKLVIVPEESCDPGFGEFHVMEDLTHLNICKPENTESPVYRTTVQFIQDCVAFGRVDNILKASLHDSSDV